MTAVSGSSLRKPCIAPLHPIQFACFPTTFVQYTRSAQSFPIPPAFFLSPRSDQATLLGSTDPRPARSPDVVAGATSGLLSPFFVAPVHQQTFTEVRSFICYQP